MFANTQPLPADAILGLTLAFREDPRTEKVDLGVGVFRTPEGITPVLRAVKAAEVTMLADQDSKAYTPPRGAPGFGDAIIELIFGADHELASSDRIEAVQTPGGCGALRLAAELLAREGKAGKVMVGDPTWPNHYPLLQAAGLSLEKVAYYDRASNTVDFDAFFAAASTLGPQDVLLLHGCCHNPTGADLGVEQIDKLCDLAAQKGFLPLIDAAYHGFANGLDEDTYMIRKFCESLPEVLVTYSCSKNFGLYRERTGALIVLGQTAGSKNAVITHVLSMARSNYSMPPAHGGAIVQKILSTPDLKADWLAELDSMKTAINTNRALLVDAVRAKGVDGPLDYITTQRGMFSLLPLTEEQVLAIREKHGVYMVGSGRINICGLNANNVEYVANALVDVM